jgi:hypothetical protein
MLHACFTPIGLCFVYTSCHFYAFFGTNLLTRFHSASSCFLLFLCFGKVTQEIFSELDETKAEVPIYLTRRRSLKERRRGARRRPHHRVARPTPWPRRALVWAPRPPSDIALPAINSLRCENPMPKKSFHRTYFKPFLPGTTARVDRERGMVDQMQLRRLGTRVKDLGGGSGNVGRGGL